MGVEERISQRLEMLVEMVRHGRRSPQWSGDKSRTIGTLPMIRSWVWGEIKAIVNFSVPNKALIVEHFGQSPSKAWAQAGAVGQPGRVSLVLEAIVGEYDFYRSAGAATDGPLAEARRLAAHVLGHGGAIVLAAAKS